MADPGFLVGGVDPLEGRGPPTWVLFGENVCENERIGCAGHAPSLDPPLDVFGNSLAKLTKLMFIQVYFSTSMCTLQIEHQSGVCTIKYVLMYFVKVH